MRDYSLTCSLAPRTHTHTIVMPPLNFTLLAVRRALVYWRKGTKPVGGKKKKEGNACCCSRRPIGP